jgi:hypothetical protein
MRARSSLNSPMRSFSFFLRPAAAQHKQHNMVVGVLPAWRSSCHLQSSSTGMACRALLLRTVQTAYAQYAHAMRTGSAGTTTTVIGIQRYVATKMHSCRLSQPPYLLSHT